MKNNPTGAMGLRRLPRLELEVQGRHPDREHPRLPGAAGQHHRDADVPRASRSPGMAPLPELDDAAAAEVAVRPHGARGLQPRRRSTSRATSRPSTAPTTAAWSSSAARARWSSATCPCAAGSTASAAARTSAASAWRARCRASPTSTCRSWTTDPLGRRRPRRSQKFTYGPLLRWCRNRNIKRKYDKEPEWRHNRAELTTGYAKRW